MLSGDALRRKQDSKGEKQVVHEKPEGGRSRKK